jgi:uncharacterized protein
MTGPAPVARPLFSADSHVIEPLGVWEGLLPDGFWGTERETFAERPGAYDAHARLGEMATDRVSAEVLYPSLAMRLFSLEDPELQARCFRRYNEWLVDYCAVSPERLLGIGLVPAWRMDAALDEVRWCADHGMRGVQVWEVPPPDLPFTSAHYEPLWEACAATGLPLSLHILTGFGYAKRVFDLGGSLLGEGVGAYGLAIVDKLHAAQQALMDITLSGALDRHRGLRLVVVENEVGWLPFFQDQLDYYVRRFEGKGPVSLERPVTEIFADQLFVTFFRDPNVAAVARVLPSANVMWSSDYPHGNSTWPHSQQVVADRLVGLDEERAAELTWHAAARLYGSTLEPAVPPPASDGAEPPAPESDAAEPPAPESDAAEPPAPLPTAVRFSIAGTPLLRAGNTHRLLASAPSLWAHVKVYAQGGENGVHLHPHEDHLFFVVNGEATFVDAAGSPTTVGPFDGMLVPRGAPYAFSSSGSDNLVMLRVGAPATGIEPAGGSPTTPEGMPAAVTTRLHVDGSAAPGDDPANLAGAVPGVVDGNRRLAAPSPAEDED